MADKPNEGLDLLQEMTKTDVAPPVAPPPRLPAPRNEGEALLHEMIAGGTTGGEARANTVEGSPVVALKPPTVPQKMAAPVVHGLSAMGDMGNVIGGLALKTPSDYINPFRWGVPTSPEYQQFLDKKDEASNQMLGDTGTRGSIKTWARQAGIVPEDENWKPTDWLSRMMYDTTNLGTQLISGAGFGKVLGAAKSYIMGAPTASAVRTTLPPLANRMRDTVVPSLVGGAAGATAHSVAPQHPEAEDLAMAGGALLPALARAAVPSALVNIAEDAYGFFKKPGDSDTGRRLAEMLGKSPGELLREYTTAKGGSGPPIGPPTPPALPNIEGWSPSPGAMTGNTALLGLERKMADSPAPLGDPLNPGQRITPAELTQRNAEALQGEIKNAAPAGDPRIAAQRGNAIVTRAQRLAESRGVRLTGEADALDEAAQQAQRLVEAQMPPIAAGERTAARAGAANRFHGALEDAESAATTQGGHLFDAVDPDKSATVPMYRLREALEDVRRTAVERGRTDAVPSIMRKPVEADGLPVGDKVDEFLHNFESAEPRPQFLANVPYERVKGLRSRLTTLQRDATDPQQRDFYGRLIKGVDDAVGESSTGQLAERYNTARTFWRENVAEPFREGVVANILKNDKNYTGASQLLAPGERGGQNIQQIVPTIRRDPQLYQATVDHARADMVATTTDVNGRVNGAKLKEWVDKHAPVLQHFPELQTEFTRLAQAQRTADQYLAHAEQNSPELRALAKQGIKNTEDNIRNSAARFYLNAEPEDVIGGIMKLRGSTRAKAAREAMDLLKTPEAKEGLQRAYYDNLQRRVLGGEDREAVRSNWKSNFSNVLDNESDIANVLLTPGVRNRLKGVDKATHAEGARQNARANAGSRTSEDMPHGNGLTGLLRELRPDLPTMTGGATLGAGVGSVVPGVGTAVGAMAGAAGAVATRRLMLARMAAREAAVREAIFDPAIYERVMSAAEISPATRRMLGKKIKPYLVIANSAASP